MDQRPALAIVGYSYRAPSVGGTGLWEFLSKARSAWSRVPEDRFCHDTYYHPKHEKAGTFSSKGAHFLPGDVYTFDAPFFNLRADEAKAMDPQQRMLLECAFEAAENAGISLNALTGSNVGVFAANESLDYGDQTTQDPPSMNQYTGIGMAPCMFANRLSYFFDLKGPSISVDAACASSSYAIHLAARSLQTGECSAAFVGGAHLILSPTPWIILDNAGMLSPDGKSYSYDTRACGFGRGEGAACLVIKRLADAVKDGDCIRAIIRNTAASHSGRTNGITMPSQPAQVELLTRLHREVNLDPRNTQYIEGHGTGTQVGDPVDAGSIATVFGSTRTASDPVYIGALKSNFGHTEGASGVLGVVKTVMMLEKGYILPNANFENMSHKIVGRERLMVVKSPTPWPPGNTRRACATNFGFGGANAAVLLEAATPASISSVLTSETSRYCNSSPSESESRTSSTGDAERNSSVATSLSHTTNGSQSDFMFVNGTHSDINANDDSPITNGNGVDNGGSLLNDGGSGYVGAFKQVLVFSAKSDASLISYLATMVKYLEQKDDNEGFLKDLGFTLGQRRTRFTHRHAISAQSVQELVARLESPLSAPSRTFRSGAPIISFVFTGQGAQYAQMVAGLYSFREFSTTIRKADGILRKLGAPWSLIDELNKSQADSDIDNAQICQPACTAVQLALVTLIRDVWRIEPSIVLGHSSGEIAAAYAARHISFKTALAVAFFRGQAAVEVQRNAAVKGGMLALGVGQAEASELIVNAESHGYATVAAINSFNSVTVSGDEAAIDCIQKAAEGKNVFARRLKINVAYHSKHMASAEASYLMAIKPFFEETLTPAGSASSIFVSSVTGQVEPPQTTQDPSYWIKNLLNTVQFSGAVERMCQLGEEGTQTPDILIEIGPHSALKTPVKNTLDRSSNKTDDEEVRKQVSYLPSLVRGSPPPEALLDLAAKLFTAGCEIDMNGVNQTENNDVTMLNDLPAYEWNKNASYIHRARIAAERLANKIPFSPLLGWKSPHAEGSEVAFRNVFMLDDLPWIRGHNIGGEVLFPLTGFMSLVIEAARTMLSNIKPTGISLKEFHAKASLKIGEEDRVDITTKLRPSSTGTENFSSTNWSFEILTWSDQGGWIKHCYGRVEALTDDLVTSAGKVKTAVNTTSRPDIKSLDPEHEYAMADLAGTVYGPEYRTMTTLRQAPGIVVHQIKLRDLDPITASSTYGSPVTVDPPTLDAFFHALSVIQETEDRGLYVPTYFTRAHISNDIPVTPGKIFTIVTQRLQLEPKSGTLRMNLIAYAETDGSYIPAFEVENLTLKCIRQPILRTNDIELPDGFKQDLVPYLDLVDESFIDNMFSSSTVPECDLLFQRQVEQVSLHLMGKALEETANDDANQWPPFMMKARDWAARLNPQVMPEQHANELMEIVSNHSTPGKMSCVVGKQFTQILRGEVKPLEIMLQDGLLSRHYEEDLHTKRGSASLARLIKLLADTNPNMRVLEVGAGTGGTSYKILEALTAEDEDEEAQRTWHYTYTDISSGFFENARVKFGKWSNRITYQKLDISQDPLMQGLAAENFDLIVAANVLHATPNMDVTMRNVATLLKPRGTLALLEVITHSPVALPFAVLPGWWLSEDKYRGPDGPLMTKPVWNDLLLDTGFDGVRGYVCEYPERERLMAAMWSKKKAVDIAPGQQSGDHTITICGTFATSTERQFAEVVAKEVGSRLGCEPLVTAISQIAKVHPSSRYICLDSSEESIFHSMTAPTFENLKTIILESAGILWVRPEQGQPETGFARAMLLSIRHEDMTRRLFFLDTTPWNSTGASCIAKVTGQLCDPGTSQWEQEFSCKDGVVQVPRTRHVPSTKQAFAMEAGIPVKERQSIWNGSKNAPLELTIDTLGSLDSIYFRRSQVLELHKNDAEHVLIQVTAAGINFRDLLLVLGSLPWMSPGFEGVGTVLRTGTNVQNVKAGDRVVFVAKDGGSFATHVRVNKAHLCKLPNGADPIALAGTCIAFLTAYIAVVQLGQLKSGESILIHAATGAVGQACIALARLQGATNIYATAGTPEKRTMLHRVLGIPMSHIFNSRTAQFKEGVSVATGGRGVDIVINSLSGELLQHSWMLVADFGRFIEIGKADILQHNDLPMQPFNRSVTFSSLDVLLHLERRPLESQAYLTEVVRLIESGAIPLITPTVALPISDIASAFRKLQLGQNIGKMVVTMDDNAEVLAECVPHLGLASSKENILCADETYIITGGTGGIGRDLAVWMFDNGARNVVLLGRSGSSSPEVAELLRRYSETEYNLRAIACDVASKHQLESALKEIHDLPRVCGVVHGALYLKDAMFVNATYDDWTAITGPKIQAAWHLHHLLPNLRFFVTLGSIEGLTGNTGQSIYAGTSSFMDAFVKYRNDRGLAASSVHLPVVQEVGYVAKLGIFDSMKDALGLTMTPAQLHTVIKGAIIGPSSGLSADGCTSAFVRLTVPSSEPPEPWERFNALYAMRRRRPISNSDGSSGANTDAGNTEPASVLDALCAKVAAITLIDEEEVLPKRPLKEYGLDSLVSVELRNWIRRELSVEFALTQIVRAKDLQELADLIIASR